MMVIHSEGDRYLIPNESKEHQNTHNQLLFSFTHYFECYKLKIQKEIMALVLQDS